MSVTLIEHMGRAYGSGTQPPVNPRDTLLTPRVFLACGMLYPELKNTLLSAFWDVGLGLLPRFFARQRFGKPTARRGRRVVELSWRQGLDVHTSGASVSAPPVASLASVAGSEKTLDNVEGGIFFVVGSRRWRPQLN